jgi:hypothetical protein
LKVTELRKKQSFVAGGLIGELRGYIFFSFLCAESFYHRREFCGFDFLKVVSGLKLCSG